MALDNARKARVARCLRAVGYEPDDDSIEQMSVYLEALDLYIERSTTRGQLWKQFHIEDVAAHLRSKAARLAAGVRMNPQSAMAEDAIQKDLKDSALDTINYGAFAERHRQAGRLHE